jgi:hypothetical protein
VIRPGYIAISGISGVANIEIMDLQGKRLFFTRNVISNQQIGLKNFASGSYLVKIMTKDEVVIKKEILLR